MNKGHTHTDRQKTHSSITTVRVPDESSSFCISCRSLLTLTGCNGEDTMNLTDPFWGEGVAADRLPSPCCNGGDVLG